MKVLHVVPCADEANGVFQVARMLAKKQSADGHEASVVTAHDFAFSTNYQLPTTNCQLPTTNYQLPTTNCQLSATNCPNEVWVHGMWLPREWLACRKVLLAQKSNHHSPTLNSNSSRPRLVRMTHGSLSPIYLERQGKWKKRLVAPFERWFFSKTDRVVVTGEWEAEWCRRWGLKNEMQILDLKQYFKIKSNCEVEERTDRALHVLYLGRRHPLKGVGFLERAVQEINEKGKVKSEKVRMIDLRIESNLFGAEKEKVWEWADVLCLPTLSENFGLVVAEALEHGRPVITTDGAPAWEPGESKKEEGRVKKCGITYLRGYREGTDAERVKLLKDALVEFVG